MKKIFFALAALVLAFTGCSQEEDAIQVSEKKAVKVVVNMDKPGFGEDTRAARTDWEDGDNVAVVLNNDFDKVFFLTYSKSTSEWTSELFFYIEDYRYYGYIDEDEDYNPGPEHIAEEKDYLSSLTSGGSSGGLKAIYCSSGISYYAPIPEDAATDAALTGVNIVSFASDDKLGECIMTFEGEDGSFEVSGNEEDGYVLTLHITMVPQVAQFTIKDLSAGTDANTGKLSDGGEVGVGGLIAYSGGTITSSGITLNQVAAGYFYKPCWVHPNTDGISIYAAVDSSYEPAVDSDFIQFSVDGGEGYYVREFGPYATYKAKVTPGAAIIMDGPTDATIEAGKWVEPA